MIQLIPSLFIPLKMQHGVQRKKKEDILFAEFLMFIYIEKCWLVKKGKSQVLTLCEKSCIKICTCALEAFSIQLIA